MYVATKVNAAFRFPPEVMAELDRRRGDLSKTEFLSRLIMSEALPSTLEERVFQLEQRLGVIADVLEALRDEVAANRPERGHP